MPTRPPLTIDRHLPCAACGYDLRGLPAPAACPECGRPVAHTLLLPLAVAADDGTLRRSELHLLAELAGYPVDGVLFLRDAIRLTRPADVPVHVTAADVAMAFARRCRDYFNDRAEAVDLLPRWGLRSGEDLRRIVFALVDVGLLTATPADHIEQFNGPFELDDLFGGGAKTPPLSRPDHPEI